jgi:hypothetical protein
MGVKTAKIVNLKSGLKAFGPKKMNSKNTTQGFVLMPYVESAPISCFFLTQRR